MVNTTVTDTILRVDFISPDDLMLRLGTWLCEVLVVLYVEVMYASLLVCTTDGDFEEGFFIDFFDHVNEGCVVDIW